MKAKDYHKMLLEEEKKTDMDRATVFVLARILREAAEVAEQRSNKAVTVGCLAGCLREANDKWNALCRLDSRLKHDGLQNFCLQRDGLEKVARVAFPKGGCNA